MKAVLLALIVVMAVLYGETKHIHPRNHNEDEVIIEKIDKFIPDSISASTIKTFNFLKTLKPTWFVPINKEVTFKINEPCEQGFKRDALAICREVWD